MTEKKEQILQSALRLFATQGYDATPTSQIAREAKVSEGGLFRHFPNKEALMQAVLELGNEKVGQHVESILAEKDPKRLLARIIDLPELLIRQERSFWVVQLSLKWQGKFKGKYQEPAYNAALFEAAAKAFGSLGYAEPETETRLLFTTLEGWSNQLVSSPEQSETNTVGVQQPIIQLLKHKYGL